MGDCLSAENKDAGIEDSEHELATKIKVRLVQGKEVAVWVLPNDTMKKIDKKVCVIHGKQPVVTKSRPYGNYVTEYPDLIFWHSKRNYWKPIPWSNTFEEVNVAFLKYSDITETKAYPPGPDWDEGVAKQISHYIEVRRAKMPN